VDGEAGQALAIGEGALALKDQAAIVRSLTSRAQSSAGGGGSGGGTSLSPLSAMAAGSPGGASTPGAGQVGYTGVGDAGGGGGGSPRGGGAGKGNTTPTSGSSPDTRNVPRAERERMRATEDITQRCVKLLRKTRLQVRVVVEVIHCKSPKHLITEVVSLMSLYYLVFFLIHCSLPPYPHPPSFIFTFKENIATSPLEVYVYDFYLTGVVFFFFFFPDRSTLLVLPWSFLDHEAAVR
jgi:hypothetical protein